jgi:hypothetical protein
MIPGRGAVNVDSNASLFDVVHGTRMSRAINSGNNQRFSQAGRVSAAVADNSLNESPSRLNPN